MLFLHYYYSVFLKLMTKKNGVIDINAVYNRIQETQKNDKGIRYTKLTIGNRADFYVFYAYKDMDTSKFEVIFSCDSDLYESQPDWDTLDAKCIS